MMLATKKVDMLYFTNSAQIIFNDGFENEMELYSLYLYIFIFITFRVLYINWH